MVVMFILEAVTEKCSFGVSFVSFLSYDDRWILVSAILQYSWKISLKNCIFCKTAAYQKVILKFFLWILLTFKEKFFQLTS